ncbi:PP2C family protein-serine/threonine phosphatase [Nocardioides sp. W7]|uniref:PP2C family protein-serine/threonine phosphatase n=1 Tax=Nocardioides sp. W7 TaxID=2931390 RepID=UPI001FD2FBD7|nr:PP2C family protein-serine/threonine phosphatase [Nocardioides sp. W7]
MGGQRETFRDRVSRHVRERVLGWRSGTPQSQVLALVLLLLGVAASFAVSVIDYEIMPLTTYFVWLLLGMLLLRFRPLVWLTLAASAAAVGSVLVSDMTFNGARASALTSLALSVAIILYQSSRQRSGLPAALGEAMLADLRDLQEAQATVPPLPDGWLSQSAMRAAHGVGYAGDFLVADLSPDGRRLEMVLVDVCGNGVKASPRALQFAGALGGLIGALPPRELLGAANDFLLRQHSDETFATAVHVLVDLPTGEYGIFSAGHPPALRWDAEQREWSVDNARGTALGIAPDPELHLSVGLLAPGDALLFYTDGVVESRDADLDTGIDWLRGVARGAMSGGIDGAARRIVQQVDRGDDDRAVLILGRPLPEAD